MLARTADHLFWLARYAERAENTARLLEVGCQMALLPQSARALRLDWEGVLAINEQRLLFDALQREKAQQKPQQTTQQAVLDFMVSEARNPSSIRTCWAAARANAQAVRERLPTELWEVLNQTGLDVITHTQAQGLYAQDPLAFFAWIKQRAHWARGAAAGTMLRGEALQFMQLGALLERADNTARLLDVRFHAAQAGGSEPALAHEEGDGQDGDFYHWSALLHSVSAYEVYREVYHDTVQPARVAELLMLRADMPRGLLACAQGMRRILPRLSLGAQTAQALRGLEAQQLAEALCRQLEQAHLASILRQGLHDYLLGIMQQLDALGHAISAAFFD